MVVDGRELDDAWLETAKRAIDGLVPVLGKVGAILSVDFKVYHELQVCWGKADAEGHTLTLVRAGGPGDPALYAAELREWLESKGMIEPEEAKT